MRTKLAESTVLIHNTSTNEGRTSVLAPWLQSQKQHSLSSSCAQESLVTLVPVVLIFITLLAVLKLKLGPIGSSLCAMIQFGICHFFVTISNRGFLHPIQFLYLEFICVGIIGILAHGYLSIMDTEYTKGRASISKLPFGSHAWLASCSGCAIIAAQACSCACFGKDMKASGVNGAIITMDPIFVCVFFYFYSAEKMSLTQLVGVLLAVSGALMMGFVGTRGGDMDGSISWCFVSMLFFGTSVVLVRLGGMTGLSANQGFVARCIAIGIGGVLTLGTWVLLDDQPDFRRVIGTSSRIALSWPVLAAIADAAGVYCLTFSFTFPDAIAGVNAAICGSCSVVNLILGIVLLCHKQPALKYVAMTAVLLGTTVVTSAGQNRDSGNILQGRGVKEARPAG